MAKTKKTEAAAPVVEPDTVKDERVEYTPSELVIKEMMLQKNITKEKAIEILKNPSK